MRVDAIERVYSPSAMVAVVTCRDLETALALVRAVDARGHRTRLYADLAAAGGFAEDLVEGRATWAPDEP